MIMSCKTISLTSSNTPGQTSTSDRGDFWAQLVEILVFASPTGYMLTSSGFPVLNLGIFYKFLYNDLQFSCSLELQLVISQTQPVPL
jgi:hypothetical protein